MTQNSSLEFANARIKSLENNLLTADKITRMVDSVTLDEAVKILAESNYGGGMGIDNPRLFDRILRAEEKSVTEFICSLMPEGYGVECFVLRNDYHNAKAFVKAKYSSISDTNIMLKPSGTVDIEKLQEGIMSDNYNAFPENMKKALEEIDLAFVNNNRSPRKIDVMLDRAMFVDIFGRLIGSKTGIIKQYFIKLADLTNIATMIRSKRANMTLKSFEESFINGGALEYSALAALYEMNVESIAEAMRYNDYAQAFARLSEDRNDALVKYEVYMDNALLSVFKAERHNMFSPAPIAGYYLGKLTEIKVARLILVCINNNVEKSVIRQRLRELYA
ncbi:MAG: hypothetical protein EOM87_02055 [Clostridia bacterium]|nr:hypothetical protein [Clostridia bacterium]